MDADTSLQRARQLIEAGNNDKARLVLLELLKEEPENQAALLILGGSYFAAGRYVDAEMIFERMVLLAPGSGKISIALFNTLWKMERREEALEEVKRFMQSADADMEFETIEQYQAIISAIEQGEL